MDNKFEQAAVAAAAFRASLRAEIVVDMNNRIVVASSKCGEVLGYPAEMLDGHPLAQIVADSQEHPHNASMEKFVKKREQMGPHGSVLLANGRRVRVLRQVLTIGGERYFLGEITPAE